MKLLILVLTLTMLLAVSSFAVMSINASMGILASSSGYAVGLTVKSLGILGVELTIEGTVNNILDLTQLGNVSSWSLLPTLLVSLPTGNIRPYLGVGLKTQFSFQNNGFSPVSLNPLYYHIGADLFLGNFSAFGEAQGSITNFTSFSGVKEWRFGLGLDF
jgi:outer membrane protein W